MLQPTAQYVQYITVQCSAVQYGTVQCNAVRYSTVQYSTVRYGILQYNTIQYNTVYYIILYSCGCSQAIHNCMNSWRVLFQYVSCQKSVPRFRAITRCNIWKDICIFPWFSDGTDFTGSTVLLELPRRRLSSCWRAYTTRQQYLAYTTDTG